jgi:Ca2+-binding EF-hand superfamily protein
VEQTRQAEETLKKEEEAKLKKQLESLDSYQPDYNYTALDTQEMLRKIKEAAKKYDKNHPSAVSLDGFNSKYLTPGAFRITLYRTLHVELTDKELGSLAHMFDMNTSVSSRSNTPAGSRSTSPLSPHRGRSRRGKTTSPALISTHDFLVHFVRVGYEERSRVRSHHLHTEREEQVKLEDESEQKILRQWKIDNENFDPTRYHRSDYEAAMRKITREAERYHSEHVSAPDLSLFNGSDMNPAEFREMIKRQLNIQLSYAEIAALLPLIGSRAKEPHQPTKMISTSEFVNKFKAIGWESRQQKRTKQLEMITEKREREREELRKKREKMTKELNEVVDFQYSDADRQSAIAKMTRAALKYDKNHSGSMSLDAFLGRSMEPGVFSRLLKTVLHVTLTGKELGAIVSIYDNDGDGQIDSAEFLSNFFFMQRDCRNNVRVKRLERMKQKEEEERVRYMEKERLKHSHETMRLKFTSADEKALLVKILDVGKKFAIDK